MNFIVKLNLTRDPLLENYKWFVWCFQYFLRQISFLKEKALENFGFPPIIFYGRKLWSVFPFLFLPFKRPVYVVGKYFFYVILSKNHIKFIFNKIFQVGEPISVKKIEHPSASDISALHEQYIGSLKRLFENFRTECHVPEDAILEIVWFLSMIIFSCSYFILL